MKYGWNRVALKNNLCRCSTTKILRPDAGQRSGESPNPVKKHAQAKWKKTVKKAPTKTAQDNIKNKQKRLLNPYFMGFKVQIWPFNSMKTNSPIFCHWKGESRSGIDIVAVTIILDWFPRELPAFVHTFSRKVLWSLEEMYP
jgi:hypothetical protein